jgi:3-methyladenine DNA glycosylase AlkD
MTAREAETRLKQLGNVETARTMRGFFKTGPGQYGDGDVFLGIKATPLRQLAREFRGLSLREAAKLLVSSIHESRSLALLILVDACARGDEAAQKAIYDLYLANTARINNWDLVDVSAGPIVGGYLLKRSRRPLYKLARSSDLWERRIAIVATQHFIRARDFADTLKIARLLLDDGEDLIHKAIGWMLREVGKRDVATLEGFLADNHKAMPRTALRYAIERFPEPRRKQYLRGDV